MPDLSYRSRETELMDEGEISFAEFHHCLRSLETINQLTLAYRPTLQWLRGWTASGHSLRVLDVGSGGGDMLRRIAGQLNQEQLHRTTLIGLDSNPWSKKSAELCEPDSAIRFITGDVFCYEPDQPIDLIICSLFTHHLNNAQLGDFLRWIDHRARKGWFINDLHRHPLPYHFIKTATHLLSHNRLIRNDAAVSVARSFTVNDWRNLLDTAGLDDSVRIQRFFPFRLCLSRDKTE